MANITSFAKNRSAAARPWVLEYMGSPAVRSRLHSSLSSLSNEQLLERFTWEMERLPIFHNAPASDLDFYENCYENVAMLCDDTPVDATVYNGYLQNSCIRETLGGPQLSGGAGTTTKEPSNYGCARRDPQERDHSPRPHARCVPLRAAQTPRTLLRWGWTSRQSATQRGRCARPTNASSSTRTSSRSARSATSSTAA
jgi:hypothetical protein